MGQKVNPHGIRVGVIKDWSTRWYADKKDFSKYLVEDKKLRSFVKKYAFASGVSHIDIERKGSDKTIITIYTAKPGMVIGRQGAGIEQLKKDLQKEFKKNFFVNVNEVKSPDTDAQLVAENIANQLERRISFRRAMKQCISRALKNGAKGIKTKVSGRLGGADIARSEHYHEGSIPLQTLRADIDYGFAEALTTYGQIGVKVWIYKGEVFARKNNQTNATEGGKA
ncbi:30S ribosomal protein S3 [Amygdalobacter nucleatus]|uniref:Small ribosomal subunit protein uS3 n=1 Tax=Amygdalobacter nucleatus TaxID=3029274 RepID=A0A133Y767_9FIRM|nr:ribosomal protein S3 [Amygdalobacter nucleatus]MDF0485297.1 30S ribosomal protein S3 [Amygdalobacter nucleatus]WEG36835.1 30S ribosomal protein S3 [Amygdalobacter nucleatus]